MVRKQIKEEGNMGERENGGACKKRDRFIDRNWLFN
jgi:hypothetical protein